MRTTSVATGWPHRYHPPTPLIRKHPVTERTFSFIDLFAGIGGTRLGFEAAGGECVFTSEWDRFAQHTYAFNHGDAPLGDITTIKREAIPHHDVLIAGFPCQPFSIAGVSKLTSLGRRNGFDNPEQGHLFFRTAEIIANSRPRAFLLENVKNLRNHDHGRTYQVISETLSSLGYHHRAEVIDAALVVPQHRERIYIVGFRDEEDFERFHFPRIRSKSPRLADILEDDVPAKYTLTDHLWQYLQDYAAKHRALGNGFGFGLADLDGVSRTLSARYYKDGSEILIPQRRKNPRRLTPRECARLMGFPERFQIPVSDTRAYKQFGNSVVVPIVEAVAREIVRALELPPMRAGTLRSWRPSKQMPLPLLPLSGLKRLPVAS